MGITQNNINEGILFVESGTTVFFDQQTDNEGDLTNEGVFYFDDRLRNRPSGAYFVNNGDAYIEGHFINAATVTNNGNLYLEGDLRNNLDDNFHNDGQFYLKGHFRDKGNTTATSGTTHFIGTLEQNIYTDGGGSVTDSIVQFNNLIINNSSGTGVLIEDGFGVFVNNSVTLTQGDLRLKGEAQLIQKHAGVDANGGGAGKLLRDQQGISTVYGYNYYSSSVNFGGTYSMDSEIYDGTDADINDFTPQAIQFNSGSPYNGAPAVVDGGGNVTTPLTVNTYWFYTYTQGSGKYSEWIDIDETTSLSPGQGYTMKGTGTSDPTQNYVFKGVPNNGEYTMSSRNGESSLLGNPYPSALDSEKFIQDNNAVNELLFWVDGGTSSHYLVDYFGGYAIRNLTTGSAPSIKPDYIAGLGSSSSISPVPGQYVAVGQGFMVEAVSGQDIVFNNSQRDFIVEGYDRSTFYRPANEDSPELNPDKKSIIRIGYESPEGFHRQIALGFVPNSPADLSYNAGYDSKMIGPREDELFFTIESDNTIQYVIQGVGSYDNSYIIPLGLKISEAGKHTIMLDAVDNFYDDIFIYDQELNLNHNITNGEVELNLAIGDYFDRFQLVFQEQNLIALGNDEFESKSFNVYYNSNNEIVIDNSKGLQIERIQIFNTLGQQILDKKEKAFADRKSVIPFNKVKGVYLIVIESYKGRETYKILN